MDFSLRELVTDVLTDHNLNDPRQIAAAVAARIPVEDRLQALVEALDPYVRIHVSNQRRNNPILGPRVHSGRSTHVAAIRDWWAKAMADRVYTDTSTWKPLGDCTYDDLMFGAKYRQQLAAENLASANRYEGLAKLLVGVDVDTVKEIPPDLLRDYLRHLEAKDAAAE